MAKWLQGNGTYLLSDTAGGIDPTGRLLSLPNVLCAGKSAGLTTMAKYRLGQKVINTIDEYFRYTKD